MRSLTDLLLILIVGTLAYLVLRPTSAIASVQAEKSARIYSKPSTPSTSLLEDILQAPSSDQIVPGEYVSDDRLYGALDPSVYVLTTVGDDRLYQ